MGQPKERSAKKNVFVEKYDEITSFDGTKQSFKGTQEWEFFGSDLEFCTISMLVMLKY